MSSSSLGLFLALGALVFWSLTPFFFAATGRVIGPFATNLLRLSMAAPTMLAVSLAAFPFLGAAGLPGPGAFVVLVLSGVIGLGLGDLLLYRSLFRTGPERSSLFMTLAPAGAAAAAWFALDEILTPSQLGGMALILGGVTAAVWKPGGPTPDGRGFWYGASAGLGAAACQAIGSVMARQAFLEQPGLSPLYATTLRIAAAAAALLAMARAQGRLGSGFAGLRLPRVRARLMAGTLSGPVLGMTCYVAAMKYQPAGVVATVTFMTPLLVMPLGAWRYGTRIGLRTAAGAAAAVAGVVLLGLG